MKDAKSYEIDSQGFRGGSWFEGKGCRKVVTEKKEAQKRS